jgi:pilus assembly protein CpaF
VISIHRQLVSATDLIVHITRLASGERVITEISEVTRIDPETEQIVVLDILYLLNASKPLAA